MKALESSGHVVKFVSEKLVWDVFGNGYNLASFGSSSGLGFDRGLRGAELVNLSFDMKIV